MNEVTGRILWKANAICLSGAHKSRRTIIYSRVDRDVVVCASSFGFFELLPAELFLKFERAAL